MIARSIVPFININMIWNELINLIDS